MSDPLLDCPDPETLARFLAGMLPPASLESLEEHLSFCDLCCERVASADSARERGGETLATEGRRLLDGPGRGFPSLRRRPAWMYAAASLLVVFAGAFFSKSRPVPA